MFTPLTYTIIGLLTIANLIAFVVMLIDKRRSTRSNSDDRIPEGILFFLAAAFGGLGIYLAMLLLRHKTRKWYFQIGIPLLITQNVATIYLVWNIFIY
jgi:uncharacterized membrane protein YsdA (DUF1294 family)